MPWKKTRDPYRIWLSEIILQQTRVEQGLPYYERFVGRFPDVFALASAHQDEVLQLWQGLGYYSRARNLHHTARQVAVQHQGRFPGSFAELKKLKGVGDYSAAAIASFAFGLPHAVVDGNVYRVLARVFGLRLEAGTGAAKKYFAGLAQELMGKADPAAFNQAIMDFGATVCKPAAPACAGCPMRKHCVALKTGQVEQLPLKKAALRRKTRYLYFLLLPGPEGYCIEQRGQHDIWASLYQFPLLETARRTGIASLQADEAWKKFPGKQCKVVKAGPWQRQLLTHQQLEVRLLLLRRSGKLPPAWKRFQFVRAGNVQQFGFPRILAPALKKIELGENPI